MDARDRRTRDNPFEQVPHSPFAHSGRAGGVEVDRASGKDRFTFPTFDHGFVVSGRAEWKSFRNWNMKFQSGNMPSPSQF
jgi:hypothetical protein